MPSNATPSALPMPDQTVAGVMAAWPQTIRVFLDRRMACVGCTMAGFDTVVDAAASHGLPLEDFLAALRHAAAAT